MSNAGNRTGKTSITVFRRHGNFVTPHRAVLRKSRNGQEVHLDVGQEIPWSDLYGGHTAWVGERVAEYRLQVGRERARRAARKGLARTAEAAGAPVLEAEAEVA